MTNREYFLLKANRYLCDGCNVIAVDSSKTAFVSSKPFQSDVISDTELERHFANDKAAGVAIICGAVSCGLEVIKLNLKNDLSGDLLGRFFRLIPADLLGKLRIIKTRSDGYHLYYRCEVIEGNRKLASRPATEAELKDNPHQKQLVLIETRGEGGYVAAPPTPGYACEQENPIPVISIEERELILEAARSFHKMRKPKQKVNCA